MNVMIGIDPHKASHIVVAIDGDRRSALERQVTSHWSPSGSVDGAGRNRSRSAPGPSSPLVDWAICWPSSSWLGAKTCSACRRPCPLGSGCWPRGAPTRTTPTMRARLPLPPCGHRCFGAIERADHGEVLRLLAKRNMDIGSHRTGVLVAPMPSWPSSHRGELPRK